MDYDKLKRLEFELEKYKEKMTQMQKDWAATKEGSAYGNEYLEVQIKVYQSMIETVEKDIRDLRKKLNSGNDKKHT